MANQTPQLARLPAALPKNQADWNAVITGLQQWQGALQASKWTAPTLENSWTNYSSAQTPAGYMQDVTGRIWLRGLLKGGTSGSVAFQLPFTPAYAHVFPTVVLVSTTYTAGEIDVSTSGQVSIFWQSGTVTWASLNSVSFSLSP